MITEREKMLWWSIFANDIDIVLSALTKKKPF